MAGFMTLQVYEADGIEFEDRGQADWKKYGKSAGCRRNALMLRDGCPDFVVAFPGGRGTADMVKKAKAAGVRVIEVAQDEVT